MTIQLYKKDTLYKNIVASVFLKKDTKRSERQLIHTKDSCTTQALLVVQTVDLIILLEKNQRYS